MTLLYCQLHRTQPFRRPNRPIHRYGARHKPTLVLLCSVFHHLFPILTHFAVPTPTPSPPIPDEERHECTLLNYGSMKRALHMLGDEYYPSSRRASAIRHSATAVATQLMHLRIMPWRYPDGSMNGDVEGVTHRHAPCNAARILRGKLAEVLKEMDWPV